MKTIHDIVGEAMAHCGALDDLQERCNAYAFALGCITALATRQDERMSTLLDALVRALPFIEDAEKDPAYKPGAVRKFVSEMRAAIAAAEGAR